MLDACKHVVGDLNNQNLFVPNLYDLISSVEYKRGYAHVALFP